MKKNMSNKKKALLLSVAIIAVLVIVLLSVWASFGSSATIKSPLHDTYPDWMKYIDDGEKLIDIVLPGAHDAGSKGMNWLAETQTLSVYDQLRCGVRYLDIRVEKKGSGYVIFHGPIRGMKATCVFEDIRAFIENYTTETLILDFQHFKNDSQAGVVDFLNEYLNGYILFAEEGVSEIDYVKNLTLGASRGKCLVLWGSEDEYLGENYLFLRNDDIGEREGSVLQSYYIADYNQRSSSDYIAEGLPEYIDMYKRSGEGFFVLQGQLTDGWRIRGPRFREGQNSANMSAYIVSLAKSEDLAIINIIMRDYINCEKTREIIALNYYKNTVNPQFSDEFAELFL